LLALSNDTNTGYVVQPIIAEGVESSREAPLFVREVLDSFELVTPTTSIAASTTPTTPLPPPQPQSPQQERQQQLPQQQNQGASVSIVPGASSLTDTAFQPNPVQVSVGDTVTWTNDDSQPHTVTSGSNGVPDGKFDSSPNFNPLLSLGQTFEHTFTEAGEYPYYCALHPNIVVGTVSVVS